MRMSVKLLLAVCLALALIGAPASAQSLNNVFDVYASGATSFPVIAANGSITSAPMTVAQATRLGLSWYLVPASGNPSVNVIILQANNASDTLTQWSNPVTVTALSPMPTNDITLTSVRGGSLLILPPSALIAVRINNTGTQTVTPTVRLYAR